MFDLKIAETKKLDSKIYIKIKNIVYPQLRKNPFYGTNIKKLKGEYEGVYRYRIGNYLLFYIVDNDKIVVIVTTIAHRQNILMS